MDDFKNGRQRAADYRTICNNIADTYPDGIPHGVQKDAIQNSIDAVRGKGPLLIEFRLVENHRGCFLTITDSNTVGLSGPVLDIDDYERDLPVDYHWARFESFAFTKKDPDAIGARGQGKFIFLRASKAYTMYYDTLCQDGVYRVGGTQASRTGCPILPAAGEEAWEGERGARRIGANCGLEPLNTVGTRVIIVDPIEELVAAVTSGDFVRAIEETWFRPIAKKRAMITVCDGGVHRQVGLPFPYPLPREDSPKHKVWILGKDFDLKEVRLATGERYKIKRFHAVYLNSGTVPEAMQGIALIHNGMKITSLPMTSAPPHVRERVTGYVEFDRDLNRELRKGENQHPNHYDLKWKRRLPHAIKAYVNGQLEAFGKEKLGLGKDPRAIRKRRRVNAEEWAMRQLMKHAKDLDLFGAKGKPPPPPPPPPPPKPIGVSINNFVFPDTVISPRVNWGHTFKDLNFTAYNRTGAARHVFLLAEVFQGDSVVLEVVRDRQFLLKPRKPVSYGPFEILIAKETFQEPDVYRLRAALFDVASGDRIDQVARRFWVEKDPKFRNPFDVFPVREFAAPDRHRQWRITGSINNSPVLWYNMAHPAYRIAEDAGEEELGDYLFQIVLEGAVQFVLDRPDDKDGRADYHPLEVDSILGSRHPYEREEVPGKAYDEVVRYISDIRWRVFEGE